jgi:two-component system sensor histidine kinase PilS (NtrC family)
MRNMAGGLITVDHEGKIIHFNPAAERILGFREVDVMGKSCQEVFGQRMSSLGEKIMETLENGVIHARCEVVVGGRGRDSKPIGLTTALVQDEKGYAGGVVVNFQDLTEVKRMEEMVRRTDRLAAVGELSASIAHEIRNPLASISGAVEVLKETATLSGENDKLLHLIIRESDRLNKIVSEFLQFARLQIPSAKCIHLNRVVDDVLCLLKNHPHYHNDITIMNSIGRDAVMVQFDEDQLKQLLINLMVNGMEAMPDGGELRIGLIPGLGARGRAVEDRYIRLYISDTGVGIDKNIRDRIFEPFVSTKKEGTGLGLSIVQRILEYNHGKIELETDEPRRVTFVVSLPRGMETGSADGQQRGGV